MSYLQKLECPNCLAAYDPHEVQTICLACGGPLLARYDLEAARNHIDRDELRRQPRGMWRWLELLPVYDPGQIISLGEGDTPLLPLPRLGSLLGCHNLTVKDESTNPTGTFKARGLSAAVSKARELGLDRLVIPTAGNAGGALAAYAAHAGLHAAVYMPEDTPASNMIECRVAGAEVILVEGLISDAAKIAGERARREGWFDVSTFKEPYRAEGKKIMGYEVAEGFGWQLPDVIVYPTGGGTGLVGMWKAFAELEALGWLESASLPRMVSVQSSGCAPVVRAFEAGAKTCEFWAGAETIASGLRVPRPFADRLILQAIRDSHGTAIAVDDQEAIEMQVRMGRMEGILAAPEGAAAFAGLARLVSRGWVRPGERVVVFNTGSGLKYL